MTQHPRRESIARIVARLGDQAEAVCRHYLPHGRREGRWWIVGDLDDTPGRSLYVRLAPPGTPGKWTDAAQDLHGDLLDIIRHRTGGDLASALRAARAFLALPPDPVRHPRWAAHARPGGPLALQTARRLWTAARPLAGSPAAAYLNARGLARHDFETLRHHPALAWREQGRRGRLPALLAAVAGPDGGFQALHRTWLDARRPAKAPLQHHRKALGPVHGHAVYFHATGATRSAQLLVGEGIESTLSLVQCFPQLDAAAALSAPGLAAFRSPPQVTRLLIAADNDAAGRAAAERLQDRMTGAGVETVLLLPEAGDFNDALIALGPARLAEQLRDRIQP